MKNKYQRMTKEEQAKAMNEYAERHDSVFKKFIKLKKVCIFGIIYSVIALIIDIVYKDAIIKNSFNVNILLDCGVLLFCVLFLVYSKSKIESLVNDMLVEDLREKQMKKWKKEREELDNPKPTKTKKTTKKKSTSKKTSTKKSK